MRWGESEQKQKEKPKCVNLTVFTEELLGVRNSTVYQMIR